MTNFLDQLIMLLSTDWFKPYWPILGLCLDDSEKELIQKGCREIVSQIIGGAKEYWLAIFSTGRREETRSLFDSLIGDSRAASVLVNAAAEWTDISDEDMKASWLFDSLTDELVSGETNESLELHFDIRSVVLEKRPDRTSLEVDFRELCEKSGSKWDRYTRQLTPTLPTYLADSLFSFLTAQRFKSLWLSLSGSLTPEQRDELISWYRAVAKSRVHRDVAPSYIVSRDPTA